MHRHLKIAFFCIISVLSILYISMNVNYTFSIDSKDDADRLPPLNITDPSMAFFFGGTGIYETIELFKCLMAMESLSKVGGWKGTW